MGHYDHPNLSYTLEPIHRALCLNVDLFYKKGTVLGKVLQSRNTSFWVEVTFIFLKIKMQTSEILKRSSTNHDTALIFLAQDIRARELRGLVDRQYQNAVANLNLALIKDTPQETRQTLNELVDQANHGSHRDAYYLFIAMRQFAIDNTDNMGINPHVWLHIYQISHTDFYLTGSNVPVVNGNIAECTEFNFVVNTRLEKIRKAYPNGISI